MRFVFSRWLKGEDFARQATTCRLEADLPLHLSPLHRKTFDDAG
jgi:hypothetical protein